MFIKLKTRTIAFTGVLVIGSLVGALDSAQAQFVCQDVVLGTGDGATAAGVGSVACGTNATASGAGSTATGNTAASSGLNATATGNTATASGAASTANGQGATASGISSTATGQSALASGLNSTATGQDATASGISSTANGQAATASAANATAVGAGSSATFANSSAIGSGATTTRANQMSFGAAANTYTMGGIASDASRAAQVGPIEVVTTDANGNLASDNGFFQRRINDLAKRDDELADGIAIALAIQQPVFHNGQEFAMSVGYGNFDGASAFGVSMAGLVDKGSFGRNSTVTIVAGVGIGTDTGILSAKAGLTFGW